MSGPQRSRARRKMVSQSGTRVQYHVCITLCVNSLDMRPMHALGPIASIAHSMLIGCVSHTFLVQQPSCPDDEHRGTTIDWGSLCGCVGLSTQSSSCNNARRHMNISTIP